MAPKGNQNNKKLTTSDLKRDAYEQYCAHLAKGKSKRSWTFKHPELMLTWETMEKYIANDPEFDPIKKELALADGYLAWEQVAEDSAKGVNKDANTASLQMVMRNKFGWDKNEDRKDREGFKPQVAKLLEIWSE